MILFWIVVYWAIGMFTAVVASTTLSGVISVLITLARIPGRPENWKYLFGNVLTTALFGAVLWLCIFIWQWLSGRFPSPGAIGFWIGLVLGSIGGIKIIFTLANVALRQTDRDPTTTLRKTE